MFLRAGEVLQRCSERFRRYDPQVDLQAAGDPDRHFRIPSRQYGRRPGELGEAVHRPVDVRSDDQHVQIAHRLAPPAVAAREFQLLNALVFAQVLAQFGHDLVCVGPIDPLLGHGRQRDSVQDRLFRLFPEALQRTDAALLASLFQIIERGDAQFLVHGRRLLRSHARDAHDGQDALGDRLLEFLQLRQFAGPHQHLALLGHGLAHTVDLQQSLGIIVHDRHHRLAQVPDRPSPIAIGPHPKRVLALKFQQVRHMLEDISDL